MALIEQSFAWWCFAHRDVPDLELLRQAADIGYRGVDLIGEELWAPARDVGLQVCAVGAHESLSNGLNDRANSDRIDREIQGSIEKAVKWKIPVLICFSGNRQSQDDEAGLEVCAEVLARVAPVAQQAGVKLAIELLNSKVDHPGYQCDHTEWGVRLCERVGSPSVCLLYDVYHMQIMEGNLVRTIGKHHAHFGHYHTAGNPGRGPLTPDQEINYPAVYRAIARTGYAGFIAHEFMPRREVLPSLREAYEQCAAALAAV